MNVSFKLNQMILHNPKLGEHANLDFLNPRGKLFKHGLWIKLNKGNQNGLPRKMEN